MSCTSCLVPGATYSVPCTTYHIPRTSYLIPCTMYHIHMPGMPKGHKHRICELFEACVYLQSRAHSISVLNWCKGYAAPTSSPSGRGVLTQQAPMLCTLLPSLHVLSQQTQQVYPAPRTTYHVSCASYLAPRTSYHAPRTMHLASGTSHLISFMISLAEIHNFLKKWSFK